MFAPMPQQRTGPRPAWVNALQWAYWNVAALHRRTLAARTRVVAITGSLGKSTTARALVTALGCRAARQLDFNSRRMVARNLFGIRPGDRHRVIEIGIDGPDQMTAYAALVRPDIVVVTSIASEHHRTFVTLENTREEKAHLVRALTGSGIAVLNGDDPNVRWMATQTKARVVFFGNGAENDVRAEDIRRDGEGRIVFTLVLAGVRHELHSRLLGRHQITALLAAAAVASLEGIPAARFIPALERMEPEFQRLSITKLDGGITLLRDEFKSTHETIYAALATLGEIPAKRRIAVLGEISEPPGTQGPLYREIGRQLTRSADLALHVGHMRNRMNAGCADGSWPRDTLFDAGTSVRRATDYLRARLQPGDLVLLKGRDNQKLERIALALQGRTVTCDIPRCDIRGILCADCPRLSAPVLVQPEYQSEKSEEQPS